MYFLQECYTSYIEMQHLLKHLTGQNVFVWVLHASYKPIFSCSYSSEKSSALTKEILLADTYILEVISVFLVYDKRNKKRKALSIHK